MLIEQLKFEEGLRLKAYICPAGKKTIGYGHNLMANPYLDGHKIPDEITQNFAEKLLERDVDRITEQLFAAWSGMSLLQGARRDACVNMAFQLGTDGFMGFKRMLRELNKQEWQAAYVAALDSKWARQTPARARRVAYQFVVGQYYEVPS